MEKEGNFCRRKIYSNLEEKKNRKGKKRKIFGEGKYLSTEEKKNGKEKEGKYLEEKNI